YQPLVVVDGRQRSGDFFADGRPKTSSFEYQALLQSRCHMEGQANCLTCHVAPHAKDRDADELAHGSAEASCLHCHATVAAQGKAHTHHEAPEAQSCLACHMPKTVSGVLDAFADHAIDVPVPENTERHGVPNACNACHAHEKSTPAQMAQAATKWWPGD